MQWLPHCISRYFRTFWESLVCVPNCCLLGMCFCTVLVGGAVDGNYLGSECKMCQSLSLRCGWSQSCGGDGGSCFSGLGKYTHTHTLSYTYTLRNHYLYTHSCHVYSHPFIHTYIGTIMYIATHLYIYTTIMLYKKNIYTESTHTHTNNFLSSLFS